MSYQRMSLHFGVNDASDSLPVYDEGVCLPQYYLNTLTKALVRRSALEAIFWSLLQRRSRKSPWPFMIADVPCFLSRVKRVDKRALSDRSPDESYVPTTTNNTDGVPTYLHSLETKSTANSASEMLL